MWYSFLVPTKRQLSRIYLKWKCPVLEDSLFCIITIFGLAFGTSAFPPPPLPPLDEKNPKGKKIPPHTPLNIVIEIPLKIPVFLFLVLVHLKKIYRSLHTFNPQ